MNALLSVYLYLKAMSNAEEGQDLIEYALIIVVFVLVAFAGLAALGPTLNTIWATITTRLSTVG